MKENPILLNTRKIIFSLTANEDIWYDNIPRTNAMSAAMDKIYDELSVELFHLERDRRMSDTFMEIIQLAGSNYYSSAFALYRSFVVYFILNCKGWDINTFRENKKEKNKGDFIFAFEIWQEMIEEGYLEFDGNLTEKEIDKFVKQTMYELRKYCNSHAHCEIATLQENNKDRSDSLFYLDAILKSTLGMLVAYIKYNR